MPNHCTNLLSSTGDKSIGSLIKPYLTDDGKNIDFEKIIPVPYPVKHMEKLLGIEQDYEAPEGQNLPEWFKEQANALIESLGQYNETTYGYRNPYTFHCGKWDTKWNAYNCYTLENDFNDIEDFTDIGFQTAWSPPINIVRELSKLTGQPLRMSYYDEGWMFGGEYLVSPDGSEQDNCYDDIKDCPEHLKEELDVQYYLDCMEENEEDDGDEE